MKRSEYGKIIALSRLTVEEGLAGQDEMISEKGETIRREPVIRKEKEKNSNSNEILDEFRSEISACVKCRLGKSRTKFVFGEGSASARLMFIGEGPGYDEDHQGRPFIGRAGQLLTKIIESIGLKREDVFIANLVKCHPMKDPANPESRGNDRPPAPDEIAACLPYLLKQIDIIKPGILCSLGSFSSRTLLNTEETISSLRGKFKVFDGIPLMPTYHPAALLRNPALKKDVWEDMKNIRAELKKLDK